MENIIKILILLLFCNNNINGQNKLNPKIQKIVEEIANNNRVESSHLGFAGMPSSQWEKYQELIKIATSEDLILLTDYDNPSVRCYSFKKLVEDNHSDIYELTIKHLQDKDTIITQNGCVLNQLKVGDYFLKIMGYNRKRIYSKLTIKQKHRIDNLLLYGKNIDLEAKNKLIKGLNKHDKYYLRLQDIAKNENNEIALVKVATYKKEADKDLIKKWLNSHDDKKIYFALQAVLKYTDPSFLPNIEKIHHKEITKEYKISKSSFFGSYDYHREKVRMLNFVIAKYRNPKSQELLEKTQKIAKGRILIEHCEYIWVASKLYSSKHTKSFKKSTINILEKENPNSSMKKWYTTFLIDKIKGTID